MAREFQSGLDDMVREAERDDLRKAAKQVTDFSIENEIKKAVDPDGSMAEDFKKTEAEMNAMLADAEKPEGFQPPAAEAPAAEIRSEERRVGKECVSPSRSRWSPDHEKKNTEKHAKRAHKPRQQKK